MQFLQLNVARMEGATVLQSQGKYYIGIPLEGKWVKDNNTVLCNFVMSETQQFGHTFVIAESTKDKTKQMPIIGHCNPYIPKTSSEAQAGGAIPQELLAQTDGNNQGGAGMEGQQNMAPQTQQPSPQPISPSPQVQTNPTTGTPVDLNDPNQKAIPGAYGDYYDVKGQQIPNHLLPLYHT